MMENVQTLEIIVKCYFTEEEIDICKILKETCLRFVKDEFNKSGDESS